MFRVKFSEKAIKSLKKTDKQIARMIIAWIEKNLENTNNPREKGKGLSHDKKDIWRYRVGNYRILVNILDDELIVLVIEYGHRKDIYK
ncbi:MAG: type II toxin-antitoxin system RelE/ParE family toxin [Acholeplasmataceae bacterium]|nr:type II toxin-antitoxin system RelE/ParE family toxin [Acholeplasmataceae bacterium]